MLRSKHCLIRMLSELRQRIYRLSEGFNRKIRNIKMDVENTKKNQSEMKDTNEMKNILDRITRLSKAEDQIRDLGDKVAENTPKEKRIQKIDESLISSTPTFASWGYQKRGQRN